MEVQPEGHTALRAIEQFRAEIGSASLLDEDRNVLTMILQGAEDAFRTREYALVLNRIDEGKEQLQRVAQNLVLPEPTPRPVARPRPTRPWSRSPWVLGLGAILL